MMTRLNRTPFAAVIAVLLTISAITLPFTPACLALADQVRPSGAEGRDGRDGRHGYEGRDGRSQSERAGETPIQLETLGESG